ncbi:MAG: protein phosphatase 2C domain-containing protein [Bulleidia sp.]|nr:protein phosphatase 2C domain-containing protein [Bulleidia sp.]
MSLKGARHQQNEDAFLCIRDRESCLCIVADGASCCRNGKTGAWLAVLAIRLFSRSNPFFMYTPATIRNALTTCMQKLIAIEAACRHQPFESYGCTVAASYIDFRIGAVCHYSLGDCTIFRIKNQRMQEVIHPLHDGHHGTVLITSPGCEKQASCCWDLLCRYDHILLCTDGFTDLFASCLEEHRLKKQVIETCFDMLAESIRKRAPEDDCTWIDTGLLSS